eukprot:118788-Chlamydomonas_euryale.AAC.1
MIAALMSMKPGLKKMRHAAAVPPIRWITSPRSCGAGCMEWGEEHEAGVEEDEARGGRAAGQVDHLAQILRHGCMEWGVERSPPPSPRHPHMRKR